MAGDDPAQQNDANMKGGIMEGISKKKKRIRRIALTAVVLVGVAILYWGVHRVCSEVTMKPFFRGDEEGLWYAFEDGDYEISARGFYLFDFYGEVHVQRKGSNRVVLGSEEQKPTACLLAWRYMSSTKFGLLITTVLEEKGIVAYMAKIDENGNLLNGSGFSGESQAVINSFIENNKQEILDLIGIYKSIGE